MKCPKMILIKIHTVHLSSIYAAKTNPCNFTSEYCEKLAQGMCAASTEPSSVQTFLRSFPDQPQMALDCKTLHEGLLKTYLHGSEHSFGKIIRLSIHRKIFQATPGVYKCQQLDAKVNLIVSLGTALLSHVTYEDVHAFGMHQANCVLQVTRFYDCSCFIPHAVKDGKSPSSEKGVLSKVQDFKIRFYFEESRYDSAYDFLKQSAHDSALIKASCKAAFIPFTGLFHNFVLLLRWESGLNSVTKSSQYF